MRIAYCQTSGKNRVKSAGKVGYKRKKSNMKSCQRILCLAVLLTLDAFHALAAPAAEADIETHHGASVEEPQFVVITDDVIPDVDNTTQKVIRVNPLDLPPIKDDPTGSTDSSLYNIQSLMPPPKRKYVNSKRMRKPRPLHDDGDTPIIRHVPDAKVLTAKQMPHHKKKQLHFLYNQEGLDGRVVGKSMRVHTAPGAYPVYYAVSKSNGRFGKFPIKGFHSKADFMKYLLHSKAEHIELAQRFDN